MAGRGKTREAGPPHDFPALLEFPSRRRADSDGNCDDYADEMAAIPPQVGDGRGNGGVDAQWAEALSRARSRGVRFSARWSHSDQGPVVTLGTGTNRAGTTITVELRSEVFITALPGPPRPRLGHQYVRGLERTSGMLRVGRSTSARRARDAPGDKFPTPNITLRRTRSWLRSASQAG